MRTIAQIAVLLLLILTPLFWSPPAAADTTAAGQLAADRQILVLLHLPANHTRASSGYQSGADYSDDLARSAGRHLALKIARAHGLSLVEDWPMPLLGMDCFVMLVPEGKSIDATLVDVQGDDHILFAQPMQTYKAMSGGKAMGANRAMSAGSLRGDPLLAAQPSNLQWHLQNLHKFATGRGVVVAVIDSAVDRMHPDLIGQISTSQNFVAGTVSRSERHGTAVAGVIAAKADNGIGMAGIAPGAQLMSLRACHEEGNGTIPNTFCSSLSLAKALYFAIEHHAQVINLSLAGPDDKLLSMLIQMSMARGAFVVASYNCDLAGGGFPASLPGVIAVSDIPLSRGGENVYLAPGQDVPTTLPGSKWGLVNGSSFAAAHVSGLVALVRERRKPVGDPILISMRGHGGLINACATLFRGDKEDFGKCGDSKTAIRSIH
jgi:subtilisin family serine protease